MGAKISQIPSKAKIMRKPGDILNVLGYPNTHVEVFIPQDSPSTRISICRCWKSGKFPLCDNTHQTLQKQGVNCGPAMLEIRKVEVNS